MSFLNSCWYYCVEDAAFWYIVGYITSTAGYSDLSGIIIKQIKVGVEIPQQTSTSQASAPIKHLFRDKQTKTLNCQY